MASRFRAIPLEGKMTELRFVIPGKPVVLQRHRVSRHGGMYDPSVNQKTRMGWYALQARTKAGIGLFKGDLGVFLVFYGLRKNSDLDNAIKMLDAFNGVLWDDDKQIIHIEAWKFKCKKGQEHTEVIVTTL